MKTNLLDAPWWLLPPGRVHPLWWVGIAAALIWIDYATGPDVQFPALYVIPVSLAAWYSGRWPAVAMAVAMPLAHILFLVAAWAPSTDLAAAIAATILRGAVILVMALWFARLAAHERALHRHVQRLEGLLPICCFCKSIRTQAGDWEPLESYISKRSEAQFSHGFCPPCGKEHYADILKAV
jgi:K+-sensing histidine kinase KdpD